MTTKQQLTSQVTEEEIDPSNTFFINTEYKTMIIPVYLSLVI